MLAKRIIPCLDIIGDRTVKGVNFKSLKDVGNAVALSQYYTTQGADELVLLDITSTIDKRTPFIEVIKNVASEINIPFTVGGGVRSLAHIDSFLQAGAEKIAINTAAVLNPKLITQGANQYGSQAIVVAIDTKKIGNQEYVFTHAGKNNTGILTQDWAKKVEDLGAGEILLTSIDQDGTHSGFGIDITQKISKEVKVPIIASGGAGSEKDFKNVFEEGMADAALAAGIFHRKELSIIELKQYLQRHNIEVRL